MMTNPEVTNERIADMRAGKTSSTVPSDGGSKVIMVAYHPGDVIRAVMKHLVRTDMTELGLRDLDYILKPNELELLFAYRETSFNPKQIADANFGDWCRYVMASELLARGLHTENKVR